MAEKLKHSHWVFFRCIIIKCVFVTGRDLTENYCFCTSRRSVEKQQIAIGALSDFLKCLYSLGRKVADAHLKGQVVVLLLLVGTQGVPPLPQDLAHRPIVLVGVALVHQSTMAFAEDHERIHGTADVVLLPLGERFSNKRAAHVFCSKSLNL